MPLTPFHLGPAILFGLLFFRYLDFPTFLVANVIVDVEPLVILILGINQPLHGFFHSFVGGTLVSILLAFVMMRIGKLLNPLMNSLRLEQKRGPWSVFYAALSGVYLHIFLDAQLYTDIKPFYPLQPNPLFRGGLFTSYVVYSFCVISALAGVVLYFLKLFRHSR